MVGFPFCQRQDGPTPLCHSGLGLALPANPGHGCSGFKFEEQGLDGLVFHVGVFDELLPSNGLVQMPFYPGTQGIELSSVQIRRLQFLDGRANRIL